ncbi:peptidase S41, partial [bacterium]|nr:peptidase S41 [bacterium]
MSCIRVLIASAILTAAAAAFATEAMFCRYPAVNNDGSVIVFSYQGDLWRVPAAGGNASRLTAHEAYDGWPVFAPDGASLAFASNRYGDYDVYVMPATGGPPTRLTHAETTDRPCAFAPDGDEIYFSSRRLFDFPMSPQIQVVPVAGGTPLRLADFFGDETATADGRTFVIAAGRVAPGRQRYRGSYQRELYRWTRGGDPVRLTENRGYDNWDK